MSFALFKPRIIIYRREQHPLGTAYFSPYFKARLTIMPHILSSTCPVKSDIRIDYFKCFPTINLISLHQSRQCIPSRLLILSPQ